MRCIEKVHGTEKKQKWQRTILCKPPLSVCPECYTDWNKHASVVCKLHARVISMPLLQIGPGVHFWPSKNRFILVYCFCQLGNGNINIKWFSLLFWPSLFFALLCLWASYKKSEHVNIDIKSTNSHKNLSLFLKCNTDHNLILIYFLNSFIGCCLK